MPAGMLVHPSGRRFTYGLVGLAKDRWPGLSVDLCHRLDNPLGELVRRDATSKRAPWWRAMWGR